MMRSLEITGAEIYGELSPEVEAMVQGMNPLRRTAQIGTFDRTIAAKQAVAA